MRRRIVLAAGALSSFACAIVACVDLFHSTSDVQSICEADASDPRCTDAAPPVEICAPDAGVAQQRAIHACAWLAACDHPIGHNKTGTCLVDAILAYDCNANPNRKPKGPAKDFWNCMQTAKTCGDVNRCVFPDVGGVTCNNGGFIGCSQHGQDLATRIDCFQAGPGGGENCAPRGQSCSSLDPDASNNSALCVGPQRRTCSGSAGCIDGGLSICDDGGVDIGYACANVGAEKCFVSGASPACAPESTGTCAATNDVTCAGSTAKGCVTLQPETVDCTAISGAGACVPFEGGVGTVPSDACRLAGGCTDDACENAGVDGGDAGDAGDGGDGGDAGVGRLIACVRGRSVAIDCVGQGLKSCDLIQTSEGNIPACTP